MSGPTVTYTNTNEKWLPYDFDTLSPETQAALSGVNGTSLDELAAMVSKRKEVLAAYDQVDPEFKHFLTGEKLNGTGSLDGTGVDFWWHTRQQ